MSGKVSVARRVRRALGKVRRRTRTTVLGHKASRRTELLAKLDSYTAPEPVPTLPNVRAAVATGERLRMGFGWEWTQRELTPGNWPDTLVGDQFDLVLLEVSGGTVCGWDSGEAALRGVLDWGRDNGVPVLAWVTGGAEDPDSAAGWIDGVHQVFLDSDRSLAKWRARWPDARVDVLHPAAQPRLDSPMIGGASRRRPQAAAVLYHGHSPAEEPLSEFDGAKLDVWPIDDAAATALEGSALKGCAMYGRQLPAISPVLSRYRVLAELGVSGAGPSWAVMRAGAAHTPVVLEESAVARLPEDLRELVTAAEDANAVKVDVAARVWQDELRDREAIRLGRAVHARHTFARRVDEIARAAGVPVTRPSRTVSAVVPTNRTHELDNVFANIARQAHAADGGVELVLVSHGLNVRVADVQARAKDAGVDSVTVIEADSSLPLGACMNLGVDAAGGQFIAKMDDDNFYGRHYLTDLVAAFDYTDAGIVGKWAHYVWLRSTGAVILRTHYAEHRYERLVQGGSIVLKADVARELRFGDHLPRGVDTDILNRAQDAGIKTYSGDRFNYVSIRGADRHAHTWTIADTALMNRAGTLVFYGDPREHVDV